MAAPLYILEAEMEAPWDLAVDLVVELVVDLVMPVVEGGHSSWFSSSTGG